MSRFFVNRPIVAIVISLLAVIAGAISVTFLPVSLFPEIVTPQTVVTANYTGADARTVEQSVATPIEQQMTGVDNMNYMYSVSANSGQMVLTIDFDLNTDPNTDQILVQMRQTQASSQLPSVVNNLGVTVQKSLAAPLMVISLYSPDASRDALFLSNYAYINLNDALTRVRGISNVQVSGAGEYAMRLWLKPDQLATLNLSVPDIVNAVQAQNTVNSAGQIGSEPAPKGQEYTYTARAQGRLTTPEEFGEIIIRQQSDGGTVRLKDVARAELGAQTYNTSGRLNGKPAAVVSVYQLPGTNALAAANGVRKLMETLKQRFPPGLDYVVSLDTTQPVTAGIREMVKTLIEALLLVILVVYLFLQSWRATLIPLLAVPVSLVGTFILFPLLGFSINTLSLFGLVLAIGLVVDDAIVVVEAVERYIQEGLEPKEATLQGDERNHRARSSELRLVLASVFVPTAFIPGITGQAVSTVCGNHRRIGADLGLQRLDLESRALRIALAPTPGNQRASREVFCLVQSPLWPGHRRICSGRSPFHSSQRHRFDSPGCFCRRRVLFCQKDSDQFSAGRRPGVLLCQCAVAQCGFPPANGCGLPENRSHSQSDTGGAICHHDHRLKLAQRRTKYL